MSRSGTPIYNFDKVTGEFLSETYARVDPMDEDRVLLPMYATFTAPPKTKKKEKAIWNEDKWQIVPDYRGEEVSAQDESGRTMVIDLLGVKPKDVIFEPLPEKTYVEKRVEAYPPVTDQLDLIMKWLFTETEFKVPAELKSMAAKCMSVKAQFPKD